MYSWEGGLPPQISGVVGMNGFLEEAVSRLRTKGWAGDYQGQAF
jgi:hypothetical protein